MITENVSTLKINKLSKEQLDKIIADGTIKDNEIYLTPVEETLNSEYFLSSNNPVGTGSLSLNRRSGTTVGSYSTALGLNCEASGYMSVALGSLSIASGNSSYSRGASTLASGTNSCAGGLETEASGDNSCAEGQETTSIGVCSYAGGNKTTALGNYSIAEGNSSNKATSYIYKNDGTVKSNSDIISEWNANKFSLAKGECSHVDGINCLTLGKNSVARGAQNITTASNSCAEGYITRALGDNSHAEGRRTTALGACSHAEGNSSLLATDYIYNDDGTVKSDDDILISRFVNGNKFSLAKGDYSHVSGSNCLALGKFSSAEGEDTITRAMRSHAEGYLSETEGIGSHAEGYETYAAGDYSHAEGYCTVSGQYQHAQGHYNDQGSATHGCNSGTSTGTAFVIGNGTSSSASNAFRVNYEGTPYSQKALNTKGADYAEFFEWQDSNPDSEDRRGYFVTLDGDRIKIANSDDYILGIISGQPSVVGNGDENWRGRYILDEFGAFVYEDFEYEEIIFEDVVNEETGETEVVEKTITKIGKKYKENPDYNPEMEYIQRENRPEWDYVGMLGVISVRDDGTCEVNGYCKVADGGIATASETGYRVIKRVSDDVVKVIFR